MWFCAADDGIIRPEGVPGPMPGPAIGTGGPGPIATPPPAVDWLRVNRQGDKGLKPRRHSKAQLVYERRLLLGVDLNFDPRFK
ncbi:hypothetical protein EYF80_011058 [Liparis tanakae]|uniref:Uncharacterized protein n=1 Tax=Liparis tanakae TaxID=230148 RepID=A0A4Z2IME5_9TELE|nr:hypothetical protein EYF80_011058 [Liparis tanakae]